MYHGSRPRELCRWKGFGPRIRRQHLVQVWLNLPGSECFWFGFNITSCLVGVVCGCLLCVGRHHWIHRYHLNPHDPYEGISGRWKWFYVVVEHKNPSLIWHKGKLNFLFFSIYFHLHSLSVSTSTRQWWRILPKFCHVPDALELITSFLFTFSSFGTFSAFCIAATWHSSWTAVQDWSSCEKIASSIEGEWRSRVRFQQNWEFFFSTRRKQSIPGLRFQKSEYYGCTNTRTEYSPLLCNFVCLNCSKLCDSHPVLENHTEQCCSHNRAQ